MSALDLARLQFAFTVSFHIIFPVFSIGLASYLAVLNGLSLVTGRGGLSRSLSIIGRRSSRLLFGMGVVSGIVMSYQFGTNWSVYFRQGRPHSGPSDGL